MRFPFSSLLLPLSILLAGGCSSATEEPTQDSSPTERLPPPPMTSLFDVAPSNVTPDSVFGVWSLESAHAGVERRLRVDPGHIEAAIRCNGHVFSTTVAAAVSSTSIRVLERATLPEPGVRFELPAACGLLLSPGDYTRCENDEDECFSLAGVVLVSRTHVPPAGRWVKLRD